MAPRIVIVAIGGPTCSGKTTLAKALSKVIPGARCLFQDDFAPPQEKVPMHPVHQVQDWDDPDGAIEWDRQRETLRYLREHGDFPSAHYSHDHLNAQIAVPIADSLQQEWKDKFAALLEKEKAKALAEGQEELQIIIADGFLMLVDPESVRQFDVRLFVREEYAELKRRREERHGYHTAVQSDPEGALWRDPPEYWDNIVWPAYLKAHRPLFQNGDVEKGQIDTTAISGVELLEARELGMEAMLSKSCETIYRFIEEGKTAEVWEKP